MPCGDGPPSDWIEGPFCKALMRFLRLSEKGTHRGKGLLHFVNQKLQLEVLCPPVLRKAPEGIEGDGALRPRNGIPDGLPGKGGKPTTNGKG